MTGCRETIGTWDIETDGLTIMNTDWREGMIIDLVTIILINVIEMIMRVQSIKSAIIAVESSLMTIGS